MAVAERDGSFGALLRHLALDGHLVDELVQSARAESPEVARLPAAESREHVAALLAAGLASFGQLPDPSERDFAEAIQLGADRAAQGVPLAGLLSGVHAGRSRLLSIAINRGREAGISDDVLLQALLDLDRYGNALARHVVEGYRAAERELSLDRRRSRTRLLRWLLLGEGGEVRPEELGPLGLRPDGRYHCVVSDVADPASTRLLEQQFARCGGVLTPLDGRLSGLTPRLPPAEVLGESVLVVAAPAGPMEQARAAHELCLAALQAASHFGLRGLHSVVGLASETALAAQPALAALVSVSLLGALDATDGFHRELASTAMVYLDHGQRLDLTATALHVHPNTVRYRLRRLQELTGLPASPVEPGDRLTVLETVRYWWALRTWLGQSGADRRR
jgi:hypothetical protein